MVHIINGILFAWVMAGCTIIGWGIAYMANNIQNVNDRKISWKEFCGLLRRDFANVFSKGGKIQKE